MHALPKNFDSRLLVENVRHHRSNFGRRPWCTFCRSRAGRALVPLAEGSLEAEALQLITKIPSVDETHGGWLSIRNTTDAQPRRSPRRMMQFAKLT